MKQFFLPTLALAALMLSCSTPESVDNGAASPTGDTQAMTTGLTDGVYQLNKVKPKVVWSAYKLTGEGHNGTLHIESGKFKIVEGQVAEGVVIFDMSRIEVTDLTGDSKERLENHLRSGDFFNVEEHPKAALNVSSINKNGDQAILNGTLTMNGMAVEYNIPVEVIEADVPGGVKGLAIQGKFELDRTKHNIVYRSQTFDDKLDWFIRDIVTVGFSTIGIPMMK
jgi:polyisoprenoid-binding protein YceI